MSKEDKKDLIEFISPYPVNVQELALWLREFVWNQYPNCNELIYDNYNTVAFGWSPTLKLGHTFCSIALSSRYVHFGFYWGNEIADPKNILLGNGKQYRYIIVSDKPDFPITYIRKLLKEAYANSMAKVKDTTELCAGRTIVKSVSPVKKRPGIVTAKKKK